MAIFKNPHTFLVHFEVPEINYYFSLFYFIFNFFNYFETVFLEPRISWKQPLYLVKIEVRTAYIHLPQTPLWWDFNKFVVIVVEVYKSMSYLAFQGSGTHALKV